MKRNSALWPGGGCTMYIYIATSLSDLSSKKALGGRRMLTIIQSGVTEHNLWDNSFLVGEAEWVWGVWGCKMLNSWRTVAQFVPLHSCSKTLWARECFLYIADKHFTNTKYWWSIVFYSVHWWSFFVQFSAHLCCLCVNALVLVTFFLFGYNRHVHKIFLGVYLHAAVYSKEKH